MGDLARFRDEVRTYRRAVGRSQQQLATAVAVHPNVLSHKLNGHGQAVLTTPEAIRIVTTLAAWGALESRSAAEELLTAAGVPPHAIPAAAWTTAPLSALPAEPSGVAPPPSADVAAASAGDPRGLRPTRLPAPRPALIGRHDERRDIAQALDAARLITLTGVGGTGKSRLAVQVAADVVDRYPDGVG